MAGKCSQRKIWPWSTFGAQRVHWNGHLRQIKINLSSFPSLFAPITIVYPQLFNNQYLSIHPPHTCVKHSQGLRQLILMSSISQKWRRQRLLIPILLWRYLRMYVHLVVSGTFSSASRVGLLVFWLRSSAESKLEKANFLSDFEKREVQKFVVWSVSEELYPSGDKVTYEKVSNLTSCVFPRFCHIFAPQILRATSWVIGGQTAPGTPSPQCLLTSLGSNFLLRCLFYLLLSFCILKDFKKAFW